MSATTPRRPNMAAAEASSTPTTRRVLGDLVPKALNTPAKHARDLDPSEVARAQSPLKYASMLSPQPLGEKENHTGFSVYPQGKKRSIYEVDDAESAVNARAKLMARHHSSSGPTLGITAATMQKHMDFNLLDFPVPPSPTERNTPTPEPETNEDSQDAHPSQDSFSAYLNYDACASQKSQADPPPAPIVEEEKKPEKTSRAELLRARLGLASYKVRTAQISKSSSEIISNWESSSPEYAAASTSHMAPSFAESDAIHTVPSAGRSPMYRDLQPVFVNANLDAFRPIGKLTPAPILLPTAITARTTHEYQLPSSPPEVVSPNDLMTPTKPSSDSELPVFKSPMLKEDHVEGEDERTETDDDRFNRERPDESNS